MNRRTFLYSLGLGLAIPLVAALPNPPIRRGRKASFPYISLTPEEYSQQSFLESLNRAMTKWRKVHGRTPFTTLHLGKRQHEDCLNLSWSSTPTREFIERATKEDWYRIGPEFFHEQVRAYREVNGFGVSFGFFGNDHLFTLL